MMEALLSTLPPSERVAFNLEIGFLAPEFLPEAVISEAIGLAGNRVAQMGGWLGRKVGFFRAESIEAGAYSTVANSTAKGLGKLANREVRISQKGLNLVKQHLNQFGPVKENELMLQRLEQALKTRQSLTDAAAFTYMKLLKQRKCLEGCLTQMRINLH